jgi:hypothetical protein
MLLLLLLGEGVVLGRLLLVLLVLVLVLAGVVGCLLLILDGCTTIILLLFISLLVGWFSVVKVNVVEDVGGEDGVVVDISLSLLDGTVEEGRKRERNEVMMIVTTITTNLLS